MASKPKRFRVVDTNQQKITAFVTAREQPPASTIIGDDVQVEIGEIDSDDDSDRSEKGPVVVKKFQPKWLTLYNTWLRYDSHENRMFCELCKKSGLKNAMTEGTSNFRTSTLNRHVTSADHQRALIAPFEKTNLKKAVNKALTQEEEGIIVAMKTIYFLVQEAMPLSKYGRVVEFLKDLNTPNIDKLQVNDRVDYTSYNTALDLLKAVSSVIDKSVTEKVQKSPVVTILTDESTDIVVHHKLCISARVVDPVSLQPSTLFLTDLRITAATGKAIFSEIKQHLQTRDIPIKLVLGLGTDGASTMTGTKEGLTGQFLRESPHLLNTHCAAHRIALCTEQAAKKVPTMAEYQHNLESVYYFFKKSPAQVDGIERVQQILQEPTLKYREVHTVRWLSFYEALDAIYRTLDSLITYFTSVSDHNPSASGLKKRIGSALFISLAYAMMDILQPIMELSLVFQKKDLDIGNVQV